jgi:uracil-DNA glycosylase family 4
VQPLIAQIKNCKICDNYLPLGANPILAASPHSKILVVGQAPGRVVHQTGIPWNDKSGDNLRRWLHVDRETFYNPDIFAIVPMGFCYPGTGKSGDLPPRKECAPQWHSPLLAMMPHIELILLIGQYAQNYYLKNVAKPTLTETVKNFYEYLPKYLPLPHPSPRNNIWQKKNQWFDDEVLPTLRLQVATIINNQ